MPDLHLDPDGLHAVADDLARVLDGLGSTPPDPGVHAALLRLPGGGAAAAEHEQLLAAVTRATSELAELGAALRHAATTVELADLDIACRLRQAGEHR